MSKREEKARRRALRVRHGIERAFQEVMLEMTPKIVGVLMNASEQNRGAELEAKEAAAS